MNQNKLDRINELARKSKTCGLCEEEKEEQTKLRKEYVQAVHNNLRGTLETIKIQNPDGSIIDLSKKNIGGKSHEC